MTGPACSSALNILPFPRPDSPLNRPLRSALKSIPTHLKCRKLTPAVVAGEPNSVDCSKFTRVVRLQLLVALRAETHEREDFFPAVLPTPRQAIEGIFAIAFPRSSRLADRTVHQLPEPKTR